MRVQTGGPSLAGSGGSRLSQGSGGGAAGWRKLKGGGIFGPSWKSPGGANWGPGAGGAGTNALSFGMADKGREKELGTGTDAGLTGWDVFRGGAGQFRGGAEAALFLAGGSSGSGPLRGRGAVFGVTMLESAGAGALAGLLVAGGNGRGAAGSGTGAGVAGVKAWERVLPSSARSPGFMVGRLRRRRGAVLLSEGNSVGVSREGGMAGKGAASAGSGRGFEIAVLRGGWLGAAGAGGTLLSAGLESAGKTGAEAALASTGSNGWSGG